MLLAKLSVFAHLHFLLFSPFAFIHPALTRSQSWRSLLHSPVGLTNFLEYTLKQQPHIGKSLDDKEPIIGYGVGSMLLSAGGTEALVSANTNSLVVGALSRLDTISVQKCWTVVENNCRMTLHFQPLPSAAGDIDLGESQQRSGEESNFAVHSFVATLGDIVFTIPARTMRSMQSRGASIAAEDGGAHGFAVISATDEHDGQAGSGSGTALNSSLDGRRSKRGVGSTTTAPPPGALNGGSGGGGGANGLSAASASAGASGPSPVAAAGGASASKEGKVERPKSKLLRKGEAASGLDSIHENSSARPSVSQPSSSTSGTAQTAGAPQPLERLYGFHVADPSGILAKFSADGAISFAYQGSAETWPRHVLRPEERELNRTILPCGDVIRTLIGGEMEMLRPDGTVTRLDSDGSWTNINFHGVMVKTTGDAEAAGSSGEAGEFSEESETPATTTGSSAGAPAAGGNSATIAGSAHNSPPTVAGVTVTPVLILTKRAVPESVMVQSREDGTVLVGDERADHAVEFGDGTRITSVRGPDGTLRRLVECRGFPAVELLGGNGLRTNTTLTDGTLVQHDTAIGSTTVTHPSGAVLRLTAQGSGVLSWKARGPVGVTGAGSVHNGSKTNVSSRASDMHLFSNAAAVRAASSCSSRADQTSTMTADNYTPVEYFFDFLAGTIIGRTAQGQEVKVTVPGTSALADPRAEVVADPRSACGLARRHAPQLFILHRDGSSKRLWQAQDAAQYARSVEHDEGMDVVARPLDEDLDTTVTTFVQRVARPRVERMPYRARSVLPPSMQRHVPRPFANKAAIAADGVESERAVPIGTNSDIYSHVMIRQLQWHPRLTEERRSALLDDLQAHQDWLRKEEESLNSLMVKDMRDEAEKQKARALSERVAQALVLMDDHKMLQR